MVVAMVQLVVMAPSGSAWFWACLAGDAGNDVILENPSGFPKVVLKELICAPTAAYKTTKSLKYPPITSKTLFQFILLPFAFSELQLDTKNAHAAVVR